VAALSFNVIELPCFITVKCNQDGHECVSVVYVQLLSMSLISVCKYKQIMIFFREALCVIQSIWLYIITEMDWVLSSPACFSNTIRENTPIIAVWL